MAAERALEAYWEHLRRLPFARKVIQHVAARLDRDASVQLASIATVAVLRIIAYPDQPEDRAKDLEDLGLLLEQYLGDGASWRAPNVGEAPGWGPGGGRGWAGPYRRAGME